MRHASLFSGIGGFDLAAQWMGWENVFQVEIDGFCQKVLAKNFPNTKRYGDIKQFDGREWTGKIDVLTGGFPCQPFSKAGKRKGVTDDRYLWPEMLRIGKEVDARWIVGENVPGIAKRALQEIKTSLEVSGYFTITCFIPASAVGSLCNRNRVWIIACKKDTHDSIPNSVRFHRKEEHNGSIKLYNEQSDFIRPVVPESIREGTDARIFRDAGRIPDRVDRLKSIGNAIDPYVAFEIFKAIEHVSN